MCVWHPSPDTEIPGYGDAYRIWRCVQDMEMRGIWRCGGELPGYGGAEVRRCGDTLPFSLPPSPPPLLSFSLSLPHTHTHTGPVQQRARSREPPFRQHPLSIRPSQSESCRRSQSKSDPRLVGDTARVARAGRLPEANAARRRRRRCDAAGAGGVLPAAGGLESVTAAHGRTRAAPPAAGPGETRTPGPGPTGAGMGQDTADFIINRNSGPRLRPARPAGPCMCLLQAYHRLLALSESLYYCELIIGPGPGWQCGLRVWCRLGGRRRSRLPTRRAATALARALLWPKARPGSDPF